MAGRVRRTWTKSPLALSTRSAQLLVAWGAPLLLLHMIDYAVQNLSFDEPGTHLRDLDAVDAFCGAGRISTVFRKAGKRAEAFDINDGPEGDILSLVGFLRCILLVLRVREGGLVVGGPPCSSFVFINTGTSRRSRKKVLGRETLQYVADANAITCRWVLLGMIAASRAVRFLTEQPSSSLMLHFPYFTFFAMAVRPLQWDRVSFPMAAYGHWTTKPTILFGLAPYVDLLKCKMCEKDKKRIARSKAWGKKAMVIRTINKTNGKPNVQGGPGMKKSAAYPTGFARALLDLQTEYPHVDPNTAKVSAPSEPVAKKAPYRWRHARLEPVRAYLKAKRAAGSYTPLLDVGLDGPF